MNDIVVSIASVLGGLALLVILLMVTIRSLLDVGIATNILPAWIVRRIRESRIKEIRSLLQELGLEAAIAKHRTILQKDVIPKTVFNGRYKTFLRSLVDEAVIEKAMVVGRDIDTYLHYFVNIRERCLRHEYAVKCAKIMSEFMKEIIIEKQVTFDALVTHRNGSLFMAYELSRIVDVPLLIVSEKTHIKIDQNGEELFLEGHSIMIPTKINNAIFVDDSSTDGYMVIDCANVLRNHGIDMNDAFVLFYRTEGKGMDLLEKANIRLHRILDIDDEQLAAK